MLVVALSCSGDDGDDDDQRAAGVTTTSTSTSTTAACTTPPTDGAGGPAEVVATTDELQLAIVDRGASVEVVSLFTGCPPETVLLDGSPATFPVGGTVTHGDGISCTPSGEIIVRSATSDDGATYQAAATTYRLDGNELELVDESGTTIEAHDDPEALRAHYEIDC